MKKTSAKPKSVKPKTPSWAMDPFRRFLDRTETLLRLMHLSKKGISLLRGIPKVVEVLAKVEGEETLESHTKKLEGAKKEAELAQREIDQGFPLIHNQAIILTWAFLEGAVKAFVCAYIKNVPQIYKTAEFKKLRIELGEYENIVPENRPDYIYDLYEKEIARGEPYGATRFDKLLSPLGISGPITETIRKDLYTLAQIRNAVIHRGGVVDHKLLLQCPYLRLKQGDDIQISLSDFNKYMESVHQYIVLLICRVGTHFGVDMSSNVQEILGTPSPRKKKQ